MEEAKARKELRIWSAMPVHEDREERKAVRFSLKIDTEKLIRKYGIALLAAVLFTLYTLLLCWSVSARTEKRVRAETEAEMRAGFQRYLDQMERDAAAETFLTGDESLEAAARELADCMDELIATYAMDFGVSEDGLYTLGWTYIARVITASSEFGKTPQEIIERSGAWEGQVMGHPVRNQDTQIAYEIAFDYLSGKYPDGFTKNLTFGARERNGGFVARNEFITGPDTVYWRYGK